MYRLPLAVYFNQGQLTNPTAPTAVGSAALHPQAATLSPQAGLLLQRFKPYLNITVPFRSPQTQQWEPKIRQSDTQAFPLVLVPQTLAMLLSALKPGGSTTIATQADDLSLDRFHAIMAQLAGVVINHPVGSSDAYRFNMREAVLAAGLVANPAQIYFLEDAIAALLPELATPNAAIAPQAGVLVINAGTSTTEMVLAKLPDPPQALERHQLAVRRFAYAGNALDQDIICRLLLPTARGWEALGLSQLTLPLPGEPDLKARYALQQRLESSPLGQTILNAVRQIKPTLCQQDLHLKLTGHHWDLRYRDLQSWVLAPYLRQVNQEVMRLLNQLDLTPNQVQTVVCTGGTAAIAAVGYWLSHKFPHAKLVRSTPEQAAKEVRIAQGLAQLPQFPHLLDAHRHQFSDYYLLRTALKVLPAQAEPLAASTIQTLLEQQGIPAAACHAFVTNLVEGHLPPGLLVSKANAFLLAADSWQNADYQALLSTPLFSRQGNQIYRLNRQQRDRLWSHLQVILSQSQQGLEEPLPIAWAIAPMP